MHRVHAECSDDGSALLHLRGCVFTLLLSFGTIYVRRRRRKGLRLYALWTVGAVYTDPRVHPPTRAPPRAPRGAGKSSAAQITSRPVLLCAQIYIIIPICNNSYCHLSIRHLPFVVSCWTVSSLRSPVEHLRFRVYIEFGRLALDQGHESRGTALSHEQFLQEFGRLAFDHTRCGTFIIFAHSREA